MARLMAMRVLVSGLPDKTLLNVNVPAQAPRGIRLARLGHRVYEDKIVEQADPRGRTHYWIGGGDAPVGIRWRAPTWARCTRGTSRVTPLHLDLTHHRALAQIHDWSAGLNAQPGLRPRGRPVGARRRADEEAAERLVERPRDATSRPARAWSTISSRAARITDERVLAAMRRVPRHRFVEEAFRERAYGDHPLPIGAGADDLPALHRGPHDLAPRADRSGEGPRGRHRLGLPDRGARRARRGACARSSAFPAWPRGPVRSSRRLGYANVWVRVGNGTLGWPDEAPFDRILVAAGGPSIPPPLFAATRPRAVAWWCRSATRPEPDPDPRGEAWAGR